MAMIRKASAALALLAMTACAGVEPASRNASPSETGLAAVPQSAGQAAAQRQVQVLQSKYLVSEVRVNVPRTLKVSEANTFLPQADIVWRGEPRGDRYAQVAQVFNDGLLAGTKGMATGPSAIVEIEVTRFHCLTEKTRFTVGGLHAIHFTLTVRDAATGAVLEGPRPIIADVKASGGAAALAEDQAGRTQRVVVVERIAEVIRRELSAQVAGPEAQAAIVARFQDNMLITATGLGL